MKRSASFTIVTIAAFLCGAILAPTLHQTFHHADHIHVGDSIIFLHDHHHDDDHDHGAADHDDDGDDDDDHHHDADHHDHHDDHDHGATSLWHFGAVLGEEGAFAPLLAAIAVVARIPSARAECHEALVTRAIPTLRGPPSRAAA